MRTSPIWQNNTVKEGNHNFHLKSYFIFSYFSSFSSNRTEEERAIQAACDKKRKKRVRILFTNFQEIQESTKIYFRALCWNHVCWFPWTIKEALLYRIWKSQPRQLYSSKKTNSSSIPSWQFSKFSKKLHLFPLLQLQQWRLSSVTNAPVCSKLKVVWRCTLGRCTG